MDKFDYLTQTLDSLTAQNLRRTLTPVLSAQGPVITTNDPGCPQKVLFCSNNYLSLAADPAIKSAVTAAVEKYGFGSAASRLISGTMAPHLAVESAFADFLHKPAALLLPSGWTANQALLTALPGPEDLVLIDKLDHASIIDAVKASPAKFRTYRHDRPDRLEKLLAGSAAKRKFIVTESVFSMSGRTADLPTLVDIKNKHGAILILDQAHCIGCMGQTGRGLPELTGLSGQVDIIVAPLGKAFAANGAVIAGPQDLIDLLINTARPFIYTTAPSPVLCEAILAALHIVKTQPRRRESLGQNARLMRNLLSETGRDTAGSKTHIIPLILGTSEKALEVSKTLYEQGFFVSAIRPPTVPKNTARLRISIQSAHTEQQIRSFANCISK